MALGTSSKRYAKALVSHSIEEGNLDVMFDEINSLINILEESDDLKAFISNPTISRENKTKFLNELTGPVFAEYFNFIKPSIIKQPNRYAFRCL